MTYNELKPFEGKYGLLSWDISAERKEFHGTIKYVDDDGYLLFKVKGVSPQKIKTEEVVGFTEKEMLAEVTKHSGKDVVHDGGNLIYKEQLRYADASRERRINITLKR